MTYVSPNSEMPAFGVPPATETAMFWRIECRRDAAAAVLCYGRIQPPLGILWNPSERIQMGPASIDRQNSPAPGSVRDLELTNVSVSDRVRSAEPEGPGGIDQQSQLLAVPAFP